MLRQLFSLTLVGVLLTLSIGCGSSKATSTVDKDDQDAIAAYQKSLAEESKSMENQE